MPTRCLSMLALAFLLLPPTLAAQSTAYADPQGRFTVEKPEGWTTILMGDHGVALSTGGGDVVINPFAANQAPGDVVRMLVGQISPQWKGLQVVDRQESTFQGWPAAWIAYTGTNPHGQPGVLRLIGIKGDGQMVAIIVSFERASYDGARPAIDRVFQSLRLRGSNAAAQPTPSPNHAVIGMAVRDIGDDDVRQFHLTTRDGVLVTQLRPGSPAQRAGVAPGDELVGIDRTPVRTQDDFIHILGSHQPGDVVSLTLIRNGRSGTIRVQMEAAQ